MAGVTFATAASPSPRRCRRFSRASVWGFASAARPRRRQRTGKGASPRGPRPPTGHRESLAKRSRARSSRSFCPPHANWRAETPEATGSGFPWKSATAEFTNPTRPTPADRRQQGPGIRRRSRDYRRFSARAGASNSSVSWRYSVVARKTPICRGFVGAAAILTVVRSLRGVRQC
jgi:hypothetical protein